VLALLVNVTLSIYKPRGLTAFARRRQAAQPDAASAGIRREPAPVWIMFLAGAVVVLIVAFVVLHLAGSGLGALHHLSGRGPYDVGPVPSNHRPPSRRPRTS